MSFHAEKHENLTGFKVDPSGKAVIRDILQSIYRKPGLSIVRGVDQKGVM